MATRAGGFAPRVAPITGVGPVDSAGSADGGDLVNHYFIEALMRRLEELESREQKRVRESRREYSEDFQSWLKIPAPEQDEKPAPNKFTRERAINSYRKTAGIE